MISTRRAFATLLVALSISLLISVASASAEKMPEAPSESGISYDPDGNPIASGELIVVYEDGDDGLRTSSVQKSLSSVDVAEGADVAEDMPLLDAQVVEFPEVSSERSDDSKSADLAEIKASLEEDPAVEEVYYNYVRTGMSNDPGFGRQYAIKKPGFPTAWGRSPRGVRVAVVDSGVSLSHPDLSGKVVKKYDFRNNNTTVEDYNGHGTFIAGIIAAKTNNGIGIAGGCPKCTIIAAKALNEDLAGYDSDIAQAINWSVRKNAKVVNLSLGGLGEKSILKEAIDRARRKGAVVTAAGGNYGTNQYVYPAAYRNVIAVAYTGPRDRTSSSSSYGKYIDVAAPGVDIYSTVPGGYETRSGSSFSSPYTAALAGILMGQSRGDNATIKRIKQTATDRGQPGYDKHFGYGRINAAFASAR